MIVVDTQLTLTPNLASSSALDLVIISSPATAMQYDISPAYGLLPFTHDTLTTLPPPAMSISWKKLVSKYGALKLTSIILSWSYGDVDCISPGITNYAAFIKMSSFGSFSPSNVEI